jgi:phasin family protein
MAKSPTRPRPPRAAAVVAKPVVETPVIVAEEAPEPVVVSAEPMMFETPVDEPPVVETLVAETVPAETVVAETVVEEAPVEEAVAAPVAPETPSPKPALWFPLSIKEMSMSTFPTFDFAAPFQTAFADLQEKSKTAYEKGTAAFGDYNAFAKGNVEAFVEAGKILAAGLQELTTTLVADSRAGFETLTGEVKELAAAKSPTDFLKLQNDLAKKHYDEAVANASKHSEALIKLANEAASPITQRVTLAVEKIKTAA